MELSLEGIIMMAATQDLLSGSSPSRLWAMSCQTDYQRTGGYREPRECAKDFQLVCAGTYANNLQSVHEDAPKLSPDRFLLSRENPTGKSAVHIRSW